jgi:hypothetical protein
MKKAIGSVLLVFWMLLVCLLGAEPTEESLQLGDWAGWVYLTLLFGLPLVWSNLLKDNALTK